MTPEYKTALIRGLISAAIGAGVQLFVVLAVGDFRVAAIAAGGAFFTALASRLGVEGTIDSKRANPPTP